MSWFNDRIPLKVGNEEIECKLEFVINWEELYPVILLVLCSSG